MTGREKAINIGFSRWISSKRRASASSHLSAELMREGVASDLAIRELEPATEEEMERLEERLNRMVAL